MKCLICHQPFALSNKFRDYVCENENCKYLGNGFINVDKSNNITIFNLYFNINNKIYKMLWDIYGGINIWQTEPNITKFVSFEYKKVLNPNNFDIEMEYLINKIEKLLLLI